MKQSLRDWLEGRSDTPPSDADLDALTGDADPALFADVARSLAVPDPDDGVVDAAWARLNAALPPVEVPEAIVLTPPAATRRRWGMWAGAGLALAAGLLFFVLRPNPSSGPADPYVKGAVAPTMDVEFLREGPDGTRALTTPAQANQTDRLIARVRLTDQAWLGLVHRGPNGAAQFMPFDSAVLTPGVHTPQADGQVVAYGFSNEPGLHQFEVWASPKPLSLEEINAFRENAPPQITRQTITVDVR